MMANINKEGVCTYYLYNTDANNFAGYRISANVKAIEIFYEDGPLALLWKPVVLQGFDDESLVDSDFPTLSGYSKLPVMSERAWKVLRPLIGDCCEALPIVHPTGDPYFIIHVMETTDCLDGQRSEVKRYTDGGIMKVDRYAFKPGMLHGKHIFKLPLDRGGDLIVDDEFRKVVESNSLRGLRFKELPMA